MLSRYYKLKIRLLLVSALNDWDAADCYLKEAERIYEDATRGTREDETEAQQALKEFGESMQRIRQGTNEDAAAGFVGDEENMDAESVEEFDEDEEMLEDAEAVAEAARDVFGPEVNVVAEIRALQLEDKEKADDKKAEGKEGG